MVPCCCCYVQGGVLNKKIVVSGENRILTKAFKGETLSTLPDLLSIIRRSTQPIINKELLKEGIRNEII